MGRSRGGLTSKIHAVVDSNGLPVRLALSPGKANPFDLPDQTMSSGGEAVHRLAANYLAFVQLASIRLWLRPYESAS